MELLYAFWGESIKTIVVKKQTGQADTLQKLNISYKVSFIHHSGEQNAN